MHVSTQKNWLLPLITVLLSESDNDVLGGSCGAGDVSGDGQVVPPKGYLQMMTMLCMKVWKGWKSYCQ